VKPEHLSTAQAIFTDSKIQIISRGQRHLDAALGTREFAEKYMAAKVQSWHNGLGLPWTVLICLKFPVIFKINPMSNMSLCILGCPKDTQGNPV